VGRCGGNEPHFPTWDPKKAERHDLYQEKLKGNQIFPKITAGRKQKKPPKQRAFPKPFY